MSDEKNKQEEKKIQEYVITDDVIKEIASIAGKEGAKAYEKVLAKMKRSKLKKAKEILKAYRKIKKALQSETRFTREEKIELRWSFIEDLMGNVNGIAEKSDRTISDKEKKRQENMYCIECVEKAAALYKSECYDSGNKEAIRRYNEFEMYYLTDKEYTVKEISKRESLSEKTIYKDIGIATKIVAIYLLGVDF